MVHLNSGEFMAILLENRGPIGRVFTVDTSGIQKKEMPKEITVEVSLMKGYSVTGK